MRFGSIVWQILDFSAKQWIKDIIKCCHWATTTNIGLLYPKVRNNIGGNIPIDVPPTKILEGMCPRHPRGHWRQCLRGRKRHKKTTKVSYRKDDWAMLWWKIELKNLEKKTTMRRKAQPHDRPAVELIERQSYFTSCGPKYTCNDAFPLSTSCCNTN